MDLFQQNGVAGVVDFGAVDQKGLRILGLFLIKGVLFFDSRDDFFEVSCEDFWTSPD
jgi:hypothetical protein